MRDNFESSPFDDANVTADVSAPKSVLGAAALGIVAVALAFGGFGIWASTAKIDSAVIAPGHVAVANKRKRVQHLEGGIVKAIAVRDGDYVREGDILIELDPLDAETRFSVAKTGYFANVAAEARLVAERDALNEILWPEELGIEASQSKDVEELVAAQKKIFRSRRNGFDGQVGILESRMNRLRDQIDGFTAEREASKKQFELAQEELATLASLYERRITTRVRLLASKREVFQLEGNIGRLGGQIASLTKEIGETELSLEQFRNTYMSQVLEELKQHQTKVLEFREKLNLAKEAAARTVIRAPTSGVVFSSQVHTVGGVLRGGETLLEIVPDRDRLIIEVRVRPQDVDYVHMGQPTEVRITAFKHRTTPPLNGEVTFISADTVTDSGTTEPHFVANVEVEASELRQLDVQHRLQPGMPAEAVIKTGRRTAMAYLLQPLAESFNRAWREN
ncbi:MAG: HlyD family type I secretion periplasmic adaptor subunit [Hyphomicrobiaceae bacterium]